MVRFITPAETLDIRSEILRNGELLPEECRFEGDDEPGAFHLGYFQDGRLVSIASFHNQPHPGYGPNGFQLRGMATLTGFQGKGIGKQIIQFAMIYLQQQGAAYVWCNARKVAYNFYLALQFSFISGEFEIKGIGLHRKMLRKIDKQNPTI